jgi:hypothetical protein
MVSHLPRGTADGGGRWCTIGDFNGDGKADVAVFEEVTGSTPYVQFFMGNGDGSFTPTYDVFRFGKPPVPEFAFDIDGDGINDLVELDDWTTSFNYLKGGPAPTFQVGLLAQPVIKIGQLQITLDVPSESDTTFALTTSDPGVLTPASVTIPANTVSEVWDFQFSKSYNPLQVFSITAENNTQSQTTYGTMWNQEFSTGLAIDLVVPFSGTTPGGTAPFEWTVGVIGDYSTTASFSCNGLPAHTMRVQPPKHLFATERPTNQSAASVT